MKDTVIFDLDGTLANIDHRKHLIENRPQDWDAFYKACPKDTPNHGVLEMFKLLSIWGKRIYIFSGRSDLVHSETHQWLREKGLNCHRLVMRTEGDFSPDEALKKKWLNDPSIIDKERVIWVFDDRDKVVKMWRDEGLTCFQVADGAF